MVEVVQVEEDQRDLCLRPLRSRGKRVDQAVVEQRAVHESRQVVAKRAAAKLALEPVALADVSEGGHEATAPPAPATFATTASQSRMTPSLRRIIVLQTSGPQARDRHGARQLRRQLL